MNEEPRCECGTSLRGGRDAWGCLACGAACCPACAWNLESTAYCARCAHGLLHDTPAVEAVGWAATAPKGGRRWA